LRRKVSPFTLYDSSPKKYPFNEATGSNERTKGVASGAYDIGKRRAFFTRSSVVLAVGLSFLKLFQRVISCNKWTFDTRSKYGNTTEKKERTGA
jgi:hypothetical protein